MDSVNKFIWRVGLPALAIFYVAFLAYEYFETKKGLEDVTEHVDKKAIKIAGLNKINSLILGGSNADFSLSAEILTAETDYKWFNLALGSEAHKDSNYWSYIESSLPENRRLDISNLLYSSVTLLGKDRISKRKETTKDKYGNQTSLAWFPNTLIPNKSIAFYLKEFLLGVEQSSQRHRASKKLGDFDMSQWTCDFKSAEAEFTRSLNKQEVDDWVAKQLTTLRDLFPNANLYFLVPSEFYNESLDKGQLAQADELIESAVSQYNHDAADEVIFIRQDFYPSIEYICDTQYHANDLGRTWRTNQLLEQMNKK